MNLPKRRSVNDFQKPSPDADKTAHKWTDEELLEAAKRIIKRMKLTEKLYNGKDN